MLRASYEQKNHCARLSKSVTILELARPHTKLSEILIVSIQETLHSYLQQFINSTNLLILTQHCCDLLKEVVLFVYAVLEWA